MVVFAVVPEEIIIQEILRRLPVKSLVRFHCVCKSWNSQLYNPDYLSHFSQNTKRVDDDDDDDYLIFKNNYYYNRGSSTPRCDLSILSRKQLCETPISHPLSSTTNKYQHIHLVGSVNGLVCMTFNFKGTHRFMLWNPTIRFSKNISVPKHLNFYSRIMYGFGWDSVTNDYKLIIFSSVRNFSCVYSSNKTRWSKIKGPLPADFIDTRRPLCVIVNGSPYWSNWTINSILKFDTRNNEFTYLNIVPTRYSYSLINLNDCLALIHYNRRDGTKVCRFDEEHKIWMKMYTIDKSVNLGTKIYYFKYGGEIVFYRKWHTYAYRKKHKYGREIGLYRNKHLHLYDPKSCEIKLCRCYDPYCGYCLVKSRKRKRCGSCKCRGSLVDGFSYTPSLVILQGMKALHGRGH